MENHERWARIAAASKGLNEKPEQSPVEARRDELEISISAGNSEIMALSNELAEIRNAIAEFETMAGNVERKISDQKTMNELSIREKSALEVELLRTKL